MNDRSRPMTEPANNKLESLLLLGDDKCLELDKRQDGFNVCGFKLTGLGA
jgi:hypothetical protein